VSCENTKNRSGVQVLCIIDPLILRIGSVKGLFCIGVGIPLNCFY